MLHNMPFSTFAETLRGYNIDYAGLFNGTSSQATYTPSTARTDGTKFTITFGVQRGKLDSSTNVYKLFNCAPSAHTILQWYQDSLQVQINDSGGAARYIQTTQKFRDPTAFLPVTVTFDRGAATAAEKLRLYIGLDEVTDFSTDQRGSISGSADPGVMANGVAQSIGRRVDVANAYIHDALADFRIIDGQALGPENFWEQDATTGNWTPKAYSGSYGNNGVYLPDPSTGTDDSGNGHDFSPTDVSQITSTPTNVFWSFNAVHEDRSGTLSNGNRTVSGTVHQVGTLAVDSGQYAWKVTDAGSGGDYGIELANGAQTETAYTASASDVLEFELDMDVGTLDVRVNGGGATSVATGLSGLYVPLCKAPCTITADFTPSDSAFKTLCTDNLPARSPKTPTTPQTGSFTGNANADGPCINLGMAIDQSGTSTINGNTIVWGTHADALAIGVKVRTSSSSYNASGSNTYSFAVKAYTGGANVAEATAQGNPE